MNLRLVSRVRNVCSFVCACILFAPLAGAQEFNANTTGNWATGSNWSTGSKPSSFARIGGGGRSNSIVTLNTVETLTGTGSSGRFIFGQGGTGNSLTIEAGGSLTTNGTVVHRLGQTSAFDTTIEGTLNVQNADVSSDAGSTVILDGGDVDIGRTYQMFDATLDIRNSMGTFTVVNDFTTTNDSTLDYTFDANGVTSIDIGDMLSIASGADLVIDASAYVVGPTTVSLATYDSLANANEFNEMLVAPAGYTVDVVYGPNSMDLVFTAVPEPTSLLLLSLFGLTTLRRRRFG